MKIQTNKPENDAARAGLAPAVVHERNMAEFDKLRGVPKPDFPFAFQVHYEHLARGQHEIITVVTDNPGEALQLFEQRFAGQALITEIRVIPKIRAEAVPNKLTPAG